MGFPSARPHGCKFVKTELAKNALLRYKKIISPWKTFHAVSRSSQPSVARMKNFQLSPESRRKARSRQRWLRSISLGLCDQSFPRATMATSILHGEFRDF